MMLSEGDMNPYWVRPGDARLLVVCSKFETGGLSGMSRAGAMERPLSQAVHERGLLN
jgi:hypothetical protein